MIDAVRWTMDRAVMAGAAGQGIVEYGLILALTSVLTRDRGWSCSVAPSPTPSTIIGEAIDQATGG